MSKNPKPLPPHGTHPLWWVAAILCSFLTILVIIGGVVLFVGYLVIHPRTPIITVFDAHLDTFDYSQAGVLVTQLTIWVRYENDNQKAHAIYSNSRIELLIVEKVIATLAGGSYVVRKNSTLDFSYDVSSKYIPLNPEQQRDIETYLNHDDIRFDLRGTAKVQWRIGILGSFRFSCRLDCQLHFHYNGSYIPSRCTSKAL